MRKKRILYSRVGHNDLLGMASDAELDQQRRILDELKIDRKISKQDGPIKALLKQEAFDEIHLLSNYPKWLSGMFLKWLGFEAKIHTVSLVDPTDYEQILTATDSVLGLSTRDSSSEYSFFLTPGTPSMAASWILVGKSRYDAVFWQSYQGKATQSNIPFLNRSSLATWLARSQVQKPTSQVLLKELMEVPYSWTKLANVARRCRLHYFVFFNRLTEKDLATESSHRWGMLAKLFMPTSESLALPTAI